MSFSNDIKKFNEKAQKAATKIFRGSALEIFKAIILRTPVDTGRLRGNWFSTINSPSSEISDSASGTRSLGEAVTTTRQAKLGDSIYLINNLPYAEIIESGRGSNQAPRGMVGITVLEWKSKVAEQAGRL